MDSNDVKRIMAATIFAGLDSPGEGDEEWACRKAQAIYSMITAKKAKRTKAEHTKK